MRRGKRFGRFSKAAKFCQTSFVRDELVSDLRQALDENGLGALCEMEAEPDGEGDKTYPEPRKIHIQYHSVFGSPRPYLRPEVMLEVGSRTLIEPFQMVTVDSFVTKSTPIDTSILNVRFPIVEPRKMFLKKAFLLHELFSTGALTKADRKFRHLYDLEKMMRHPEVLSVIKDNELWNISFDQLFGKMHELQDVFRNR